MEGDYYTERAYYLSFLNRDVTGRSGEEESLRTTPLFSLAVKHAIDGTFKERSAGTPEASKSVSDEAVDSADESEDDGRPISDHRGIQYPERTLPTPILPQYGLLGFHVGKHDRISHHEPIMLNVHAPNSAFICGSQGVERVTHSTASSRTAYWRTCALANSASHLPDWSFTVILIRLAQSRRRLLSAHEGSR